MQKLHQGYWQIVVCVTGNPNLMHQTGFKDELAKMLTTTVAEVTYTTFAVA